MKLIVASLGGYRVFPFNPYHRTRGIEGGNGGGNGGGGGGGECDTGKECYYYLNISYVR